MDHIEDLVETAAIKREKLREKIRRLVKEERDIEEKIKAGFIVDEQLARGTLGDDSPRYIMGVDGGSYSVQLLASDLYLIKTYGVMMEWREDEGYYRVNPEHEYKVVDIDFILPQGSSQDRLTLYRQITEIRALYEGLKRNALVLGDGSIESLISRPTHQKLRILDMDRIIGCERIGEIYEENSSPGSAILLKDLVEAQEDVREAIKMELAEKAFTLKKMLEEIIMSDRKLVFITKTGRSTSLFGKAVPDQYLITYFTTRPGYIVDTPQTLKQAADDLPSYCGLREIGENIVVINGYARFMAKTPALKTQIIMTKREYRERGSHLQEMYREELKRISVINDRGYPIPLFLAHQKAHIRKTVSNLIIKALGLEEELSGREFIEVV